MGSLRLVPKAKTMDSDRYQELLSILREAQSLSTESHVFYDLDPDEDGTKARKELTHVAEREKIALKIRRPRTESHLVLIFDQTAVVGTRPRVPAAETRERIVNVLRHAEGPMPKSEILASAGITGGAWNLRIRELISEGRVIRQGTKQSARYTLSK